MSAVELCCCQQLLHSVHICHRITGIINAKMCCEVVVFNEMKVLKAIPVKCDISFCFWSITAFQLHFRLMTIYTIKHGVFIVKETQVHSACSKGYYNLLIGSVVPSSIKCRLLSSADFEYLLQKYDSKVTHRMFPVTWHTFDGDRCTTNIFNWLFAFLHKNRSKCGSEQVGIDMF